MEVPINYLTYIQSHLLSSGVGIRVTISFVLINTNLGSEKEIKDKLLKIDEVKETYEVYGVYDLIVKLEAGVKSLLNAGILTSGISKVC